MTIPRAAGWRVLPLETGPADDMIGRSLAMLDDLDDTPVPALRWYRATTPAIVLGRGQHPSLVGDAPQQVVERFSGGGAVLMDQGLLCLDVLFPRGHPWLEGDLGAVFLRVGAAWARALRQLGLAEVEIFAGPAQAKRHGTPREALLAAICYATLGRGEVIVAGRKLVGLAQRRRRPGAIVQCGLLRTWDPSPLLKALRIAPADPEIWNAAIGLDALLDPPPADQTIMGFVEDEITG